MIKSSWRHVIGFSLTYIQSFVYHTPTPKFFLLFTRLWRPLQYVYGNLSSMGWQKNIPSTLRCLKVPSKEVFWTPSSLRTYQYDPIPGVQITTLVRWKISLQKSENPLQDRMKSVLWNKINIHCHIDGNDNFYRSARFQPKGYRHRYEHQTETSFVFVQNKIKNGLLRRVKR